MTKAKPARFKLEQRRNDAGHEADLLQAVDLLVGGLLVQGAVAIEEQDCVGALMPSLHAVQQRIVLRARADRDAQRARQRRMGAQVAHDQAAGDGCCS